MLREGGDGEREVMERGRLWREREVMLREGGVQWREREVMLREGGDGERGR